MKICDACGKENQDHYKFCLGCGGDLGNARGPAPGSAPPQARPRGGHVTVRIHVRCSHCASAVPVNGPLARVRCGACLHETEIPDLAEALRDAIAGCQAIGSRIDVTRFPDPTPQCHGCGTPVSIAAWLAAPQPVSGIPCGRCAAGVPITWAPDWLRAQLPEAQWIVGGDRDANAPPGGVALAIGQHEPKPIAMGCPQCGAGLTITAKDDRTIACRFCGIDVFLPDELWRRLHPIATMRTWTMTWSRP